MKTTRNGLLITGIILVILAVGANAFATSWAKFKPQEVIDKSQMIVSGKYHIPFDQGIFNKGMWVPFRFQVDKYYKGSGKHSIRVAIEQFDVGRAKKFQDKGGSFLLFLYKDKEDFWIPVGGPNGMIQIENGKITNLTQDEIKYYEEYLAKLKPQSIVQKNSEQESSKTVPLLLIGIPLFTAFLLVLKRLRR